MNPASTTTLHFVHHATVALVPPSTPADRVAVWERLQGTRFLLKDRGYYRWPPHINLLYPYLDPASDVHGEVLPALAAAAASVSPFRVTLKTLGTFGGHTRGVLWLDPEVVATAGDEGCDAIYTLQAKLLAALPSAPGRPPLPPQLTRFRPHMTLCHFSSLAAADRAGSDLAGDFAASPVSFEVAEAYVMARRGDGGQFHVVARLPLGGGGNGMEGGSPSPLEEAASTDGPKAGLLRFPFMPLEEAAWVKEVRGAYKASRRRGGTRPPRPDDGPGTGEQTRRAPRDRPRTCTTDTTEQIAEKRAARAAKKALALGLAPDDASPVPPHPQVGGSVVCRVLAIRQLHHSLARRAFARARRGDAPCYSNRCA